MSTAIERLQSLEGWFRKQAMVQREMRWQNWEAQARTLEDKADTVADCIALLQGQAPKVFEHRGISYLRHSGGKIQTLGKILPKHAPPPKR